MTRSGFSFAAALASSANGQAAGSLQAWTVEPLIRQPVSPSTRIRRGSDAGESARLEPSGLSSRTLFVLAGTSSLQTEGKFAFDEARSSIAVVGAPLKLTIGQSRLATARTSKLPLAVTESTLRTHPRHARRKPRAREKAKSNSSMC